MLNNLKNIFYFYYRQVKLSSGFRAEYKSISVIIFLMGLISIFLNKEIITELTNYPKTLNSKILNKNVYKILEYSFSDMSSVISRPYYYITPKNITINLFFFLETMI